MIELFPSGFEEGVVGDELELAAYTDAAGEERIRRACRGRVSVAAVRPGWEDAWREFHQPVRVGPLWIGPPWFEPPTDTPALVIDPGRAFGTGAHETTSLCLELLVEEAPTSLLDIGCGSGVIAIAGAKLGFSPVFAVDIDPIAVSAAHANAAFNHVEIEVSELDATHDFLPSANLAVANIGPVELEQLAPRIDVGRLIASGYRDADRRRFDTWRHLATRRSEGWAADLFERL